MPLVFNTRTPAAVLAFLLWATIVGAQTATVTRSVNLRADASTDHPAKRLLKLTEPPLSLVQPTTSGYYHVTTQANEDG